MDLRAILVRGQSLVRFLIGQRHRLKLYFDLRISKSRLLTAARYSSYLPQVYVTNDTQGAFVLTVNFVA